MCAEHSMSFRRLQCLRTIPFGMPVEPLVNRIIAGESDLAQLGITTVLGDTNVEILMILACSDFRDPECVSVAVWTSIALGRHCSTITANRDIGMPGSSGR